MVVMKHKVFQMGIPFQDAHRTYEPRGYPRFSWEGFKRAYHAASNPIQRYDAMLDEVEAFINAVGMENVVSCREQLLGVQKIVTVWYRAEAGSTSSNKPYEASMAEL
jgi:hypothetical protein